VAAHLAAGTPLDSLGPPVTPMKLDVHSARLTDGRIDGAVRYIEDPYGNVVTDIRPALLDSLGARLGDSLEVRLGSRNLRLPWRSTFSDVPSGRTLAVMHSRGVLSFSINQGDFASRFGVKRKDSVSVRRVP
jgi:S-adenosylmethionine hydrolase